MWKINIITTFFSQLFGAASGVMNKTAEHVFFPALSYWANLMISQQIGGHYWWKKKSAEVPTGRGNGRT